MNNPGCSRKAERLPPGLSAAEAARRLAEVGPNAIVEAREHLAQRALRHLWAPVPWMLEITILLQLVAGEIALPNWLVVSLYGTSLSYGFVLDVVKVAMLRWRPIDRAQSAF